jgi:hypothetical protein
MKLGCRRKKIERMREEIGWGGRIRTSTVCINSAASCQLDHAPTEAGRIFQYEAAGLRNAKPLFVAGDFGRLDLGGEFGAIGQFAERGEKARDLDSGVVVNDADAEHAAVFFDAETLG